MSVRIHVRDSNRKRVGQLDDFQSLSLTEVHAGFGVWELHTSTQVEVTQFLEPNAGIIVEDSEGPTFSGPLAGIRRRKTANEDSLVLSGFDDSIWLARRRAQPCPYPYQAASHDRRSGPAETVMKGLVDTHLGSAAEEARRVPGFATAPTQERGASVTSQFRFDPLLEALASVALAGGDLGWSVRQYVDGFAPDALVFEVEVPEDKTKEVRFATELGNLAVFEYDRQAPEANHILVAGQGELTQRTFVEGLDYNSSVTWGRIEGPLRDRRDTPELDQLVQTVKEELDKGAERFALGFEVSDTEGVNFGEHWGLHDRVTVDINGVGLSDLVREVKRTWTPGEPRKVEALIGTPESLAPNVPRLYAAQKRVAQRTAQLERRL